jgi:hypothetical protein
MRQGHFHLPFSFPSSSFFAKTSFNICYDFLFVCTYISKGLANVAHNHTRWFCAALEDDRRLNVCCFTFFPGSILCALWCFCFIQARQVSCRTAGDIFFFFDFFRYCLFSTIVDFRAWRFSNALLLFTQYKVEFGNTSDEMRFFFVWCGQEPIRRKKFRAFMISSWCPFGGPPITNGSWKKNHQ